MKTWSQCCTGLAALASLTPSLWAQVPAPPAVPPVPAAPAVIQVVPAPPPKKTLLEQCAQMKADCKKAICQSPLGALLNGALAPVSAFTGGIVPGFCPPPNSPNPDDLAKPPTSAEGAAAAIKKSEAEAKARRAAVRYLGTVDCHWFPEAEAALVNSLRGDTNECVRLEAALALGRGCCCTKKTIAALDISASGSNRDGKPAENSERVKAAAFFGLQHCLACFSETIVEPTEPPKLPIEPPPPEKPTPPVEKPTAMIDVTPSPYYKALDKVPLKKVVEDARQTLAGGMAKASFAAAAHRGEDHSLYGLLTRAMNPPADPSMPRADSPPPIATTPVVHADKASVVSPTPSTAMSYPGYPPPLAKEPKALPSSASASSQGERVQTRDAKPFSSPARVVAETTPSSQPTSLVGWLKSRSGASVAPTPAPSEPAASPPPKPAPVVQPVASTPVIQTVATPATPLPTIISQPKPTPAAPPVASTPVVQVAAAPATPVPAPLPPPKPTPAVQPAASAPAVQTVAATGTSRPEENREPDFPAPGATRVTVRQLLTVLHQSSVIQQREWAADNLSSVNWQENPRVAEAILKAAREDSAPTVRQACVRSLMKMGVYTPSAIAVLQALKSDADERVRLEAEAALRNLGY